MGLATLKFSAAAQHARAISPTFSVPDMHALYLAPELTAPTTKKPYTAPHATPPKRKNSTSHARREESPLPFRAFKYDAEKHRDFGQLRNHISDFDLSIILALGTSKTGVPDSFFKTLTSWDLSCDRCVVRFSQRFSALWFRRGSNSVVWLCLIDGDFFTFSLTTEPASSSNPNNDSNTINNVPEVVLPTSIAWSEFQDDLVERFDDDNHVRAISAAVMLMCSPTGENKGVAEALLPESLRYFTDTSSVDYDVPIDEDTITILGDAKTSSEHLLFFECLAGYSAMSNLNDKLGTVMRIDSQERSRIFKECSEQLMPYMFT